MYTLMLFLLNAQWFAKWECLSGRSTSERSPRSSAESDRALFEGRLTILNGFKISLWWEELISLVLLQWMRWKHLFHCWMSLSPSGLRSVTQAAWVMDHPSRTACPHSSHLQWVESRFQNNVMLWTLINSCFNFSPVYLYSLWSMQFISLF